jgi:hypothetical protein
MSYKNLILTLKSIDRLFDSNVKHEEDSLVSYLVNTIKKPSEIEDIKTIKQVSKANINDDNKEKALYIHVNIIKCALKSAPSRKMSVDEICQWISENYSYYYNKNRVCDWQVSKIFIWNEIPNKIYK